MASKRRLRRRQCEQKMKHLTEVGAWIAVRKMRQKCDTHAKPYKCPFCNGWHVGRSNKARKQSSFARLKNAINFRNR